MRKGCRGGGGDSQDRNYRQRDDASVSSGGSGSKRKSDQRQDWGRTPKRQHIAAIQTEESLKKKQEKLERDLKETSAKLKKIEENRGKELDTGKAVIEALKTRTNEYDERLQKATNVAASIADEKHYEMLQCLEETRYLTTVWWRKLKQIQYNAWFAVNIISQEKDLEEKLRETEAKFERFNKETRTELKGLYDEAVAAAEAGLRARQRSNIEAFHEYNRLHKETYAAIAQETMMATYHRHLHHDDRNGSLDDQGNFVPCDEDAPTYVDLGLLQEEAAEERHRMREKVLFLTEEMRKHEVERTFRHPSAQRERSPSPILPRAARSHSREPVQRVPVKEEKVKVERSAQPDRGVQNERRGEANDRVKPEGGRQQNTGPKDSRVKPEASKRDDKPKEEGVKDSPGKPEGLPPAPPYVPRDRQAAKDKPNEEEPSKSVSNHAASHVSASEGDAQVDHGHESNKDREGEMKEAQNDRKKSETRRDSSSTEDESESENMEYQRRLDELNAANAAVDKKRAELSQQEEENFQIAVQVSLQAAALDEEKRAAVAVEYEKMLAEAMKLSQSSSA